MGVNTVAIVGHGIDVVDVARFIDHLERTPALRERFFSPAERDYPVASLAARFAAKEALIKALGASDGVIWNEVTVTRGEGRPEFILGPTLAADLDRRGIALHVSLSHDGGLATASVIAEQR